MLIELFINTCTISLPLPLQKNSGEYSASLIENVGSRQVFKKSTCVTTLTKQWSLTLWGKKTKKSNVLKIQLFAYWIFFCIICFSDLLGFRMFHIIIFLTDLMVLQLISWCLSWAQGFYLHTKAQAKKCKLKYLIRILCINVLHTMKGKQIVGEKFAAYVTSMGTLL